MIEERTQRGGSVLERRLEPALDQVHSQLTATFGVATRLAGGRVEELLARAHRELRLTKDVAAPRGGDTVADPGGGGDALAEAPAG